MSRFNEFRDKAGAKISETNLRDAASDAVTAAAGAIEGAEAVARRSGLTNKKGEFSKFKLAKRAATNPLGLGKDLIVSAADEIAERKNDAGSTGELKSE